MRMSDPYEELDEGMEEEESEYLEELPTKARLLV